MALAFSTVSATQWHKYSSQQKTKIFPLNMIFSWWRFPEAFPHYFITYNAHRKKCWKIGDGWSKQHWPSFSWFYMNSFELYQITISAIAISSARRYRYHLRPLWIKISRPILAWLIYSRYSHDIVLRGSIYIYSPGFVSLAKIYCSSLVIDRLILMFSRWYIYREVYHAAKMSTSSKQKALQISLHAAAFTSISTLPGSISSGQRYSWYWFRRAEISSLPH